jgi:pimeloyl-ACP methyl ester carboxylesterase
MPASKFFDIVKRTGTFESFDGTPIYFEVRGEGRPIVLCYGIACLINHWRHQLQYFGQKYQVITFDYRGHHKTPVPADRANLSIEASARDLKGLMDHLGIERASLWGHSYGVQILLAFQALFPESVDHYIFINGFAKNPLKGALGGLVTGVETLDPMIRVIKETHQTFPDLAKSIWRSAIGSPLAVPISALVGGFNLALTHFKDIEVYTRGVALMDLGVFITLFEEMTKYDGSAVLPTIHVPTLIVSGSKDSLTPLAQQREMHEMIPGSQFLRVPYGSHCTQLDLPDYVNLRIEKFLNDCGYEPTRPTTSAEAQLSTGKARSPRRPWHST